MRRRADAAALGPELLIVHRVKECSCCTEIDGFARGSVVVVNLALMRPTARRTGLLYALPDSALVCTYEIQVSTAGLFKRMAKGAEAHEREALFCRHPLLRHVQARAPLLHTQPVQDTCVLPSQYDMNTALHNQHTAA